MSKICTITNKRPISGNNRSHAMNATKRRFLPNLHKRRFFSNKKNTFIRLKVTAKGLRIIDKKGIDYFLKTKC